ncbi:MAG: hypothetical protein D8M59_06240 [Planctomycetes bacterium]|nr:hypothetical protein [Planctomycetota bacterium]NOG55096.1 hypothetical protein [Planctomycetota bacterium]
MRTVLNVSRHALAISLAGAFATSPLSAAQEPTTQPDAPPSIKQPVPQPTAADVPASTVIKVLTGNWYDLVEIDLQKLDPASAEMVIQRSVQPMRDGDAAPRYLKSMLYKPERETEEEMNKRDSLNFEQRCAEFANGFLGDQLSSWAGAQYHLRAAYACTDCNWPRNAEAGFNELLPELGTIRMGSSWNLWLAERAIGQGRPWEALRLYRETITMGRDIGRGPFLISTLVGIAIESRAQDMLIEAIPFLIEQGVEPERILRIMQRRYRPTADPIASFSGEQGIWSAANLPLRRLVEGDTEGFWADWGGLWPMLSDGQIEAGFDLKQSLIDKGWVSKKDADDPAVLARLMLDEVEYFNKTLDRGLLTFRMAPSERDAALEQIEIDTERSVIDRPSMMIMPSLHRAIQAVYRIERQRLALNLLLAGICYHDEFGSWPDSIDEVRGLRPEYSGIDPMTGDPFSVSGSGNTITVKWTPTRDRDKGEWSITLRN